MSFNNSPHTTSLYTLLKQSAVVGVGAFFFREDLATCVQGQHVKQSVQRKTSGSILTQRTFRYWLGSDDTGSNVRVSFTWEPLHTGDPLMWRAHLFESV